jgi:hypothetical protein
VAAAAAAVPLRPPRSTRRARPAPPPSRRFTARHPRRAVSHANAVCGAQHVRAYPLLSTPRAAAPSRGRLPTPLLPCLCAPARRWPAPASATVPAQCCGRNGPAVWGDAHGGSCAAHARACNSELRFAGRASAGALLTVRSPPVATVRTWFRVCSPKFLLLAPLLVCAGRICSVKRPDQRRRVCDGLACRACGCAIQP